MTRPDFIDNRDGNALAQALGAVLGVSAGGGLSEAIEPPDQVRIATAFFSPTGFAQIADHPLPVPKVRRMLGADLAAGVPEERRRLDEIPEMFERRRMREGLRHMDDGLRRERDHLPFTRASGAALRKLIAALRVGNMEVGRYEKAFLHAKATITPDRDPKLKALADAPVEIAKQAECEATASIDEAQKRKVLVFSFFEDTLKWIQDFLDIELGRRPELAHCRDRMVAVSGSGDLVNMSRQQAVQGFAPISMEAPAGQDDDRYDLLISTDVLAEGVNLQQCRHVINFDMPWNPMRLVQRHGRIDRIGSPHNRVFMRTIYPVDRLDQLLNLGQRILDKLAMAAASVSVAAPIAGAAHGTQVFTETRGEIEKLLEEDASLYERGGTAGAAQTGEEFRQTLRKELERNRDRGRRHRAGGGDLPAADRMRGRHADLVSRCPAGTGLRLLGGRAAEHLG